MTRWLALCLALAAACKKAEPAPPPPATDRPVIAASEIKRGQDACKAYVDKICACAAAHPEKQKDCALARAMPEAMQTALDVAATADATRRDVLQANDSMRKIVAGCIEETAKLAGAGCP
ncbi:MAG TPA: hypothetical protein VFP84_09020 [Kofleriaceae bacterium]|nr:hypothetical protein [Kofleriaceae bacterium]